MGPEKPTACATPAAPGRRVGGPPSTPRRWAQRTRAPKGTPNDRTTQLTSRTYSPVPDSSIDPTSTAWRPRLGGRCGSVPGSRTSAAPSSCAGSAARSPRAPPSPWPSSAQPEPGSSIVDLGGSSWTSEPRAKDPAVRRGLPAFYIHEGLTATERLPEAQNAIAKLAGEASMEQLCGSAWTHGDEKRGADRDRLGAAILRPDRGTSAPPAGS
jgi:hypothetical protein